MSRGSISPQTKRDSYRRRAFRFATRPLHPPCCAEWRKRHGIGASSHGRRAKTALCCLLGGCAVVQRAAPRPPPEVSLGCVKAISLATYAFLRSQHLLTIP